MRKLMLITAFLAIAANAQTLTYIVQPGTSCDISLNGCWLRGLTTQDPTPTPLGSFVGGTYWTQFHFFTADGQAAGATYCVGTGIYKQTPRPDLGSNVVEATLDCFSNDGLYHIVVDVIAALSQETRLICDRLGRCYTKVVDVGRLARPPPLSAGRIPSVSRPRQMLRRGRGPHQGS